MINAFRKLLRPTLRNQLEDGVREALRRYADRRTAPDLRVYVSTDLVPTGMGPPMWARDEADHLEAKPPASSAAPPAAGRTSRLQENPHPSSSLHHIVTGQLALLAACHDGPVIAPPAAEPENCFTTIHVRKLLFKTRLPRTFAARPGGLHS